MGPHADFLTLAELFLRRVDERGDSIAFLSKRCGAYCGLACSDALRQTAGLAVTLDRCGLERGDRLAILAENRVEWALTDYAGLGLGAIVVPIYATLLEADVEFILRNSGAKGVVVSTAEQLGKVLHIRERLPDLKFVIAMDPLPAGAGDVQAWADAVERGLAANPAAIDFFRARAGAVNPEDTATILYTSGTTGESKGVVLTHSNIASNIRASLELFPLASDDVAISFLPLSHVFERMLDYTYFAQGVPVAYAESFDALPQNLLEVRPTVVAVVPRVLEKIHEKVNATVAQSSPARQKLFRWAVRVGQKYYPNQLEGRRAPLALRARHALAAALVYSKVRGRLGGHIRLIISGSAPLSPDLAAFFYAVGLPVYEGYGLTETSPVISVNYPGCVKLGTVGRVIPGVEVKLGEEFTDQDGHVGREILVRGPSVTPGYYNLEEDNRQAFVDGWFLTGDLGLMDSQGFLKITGRKKHLFKTSGGKYVPPEKLDNLFQGHPFIAQMLVLGDGRRFVSALIVPNFPRLEAWARERHIPFRDRRELVEHPDVVALFELQVEQTCLSLPPHERIRQIALLSEEFSIASGTLSPTLKIKRHVVEKRYHDLIEEIYRRRAPEHEPAREAAGQPT